MTKVVEVITNTF